MNLSLRLFCFLLKLSGLEKRNTFRLGVLSVKFEQFSSIKPEDLEIKEAAKIILTVEAAPWCYLYQHCSTWVESPAGHLHTFGA